MSIIMGPITTPSIPSSNPLESELLAVNCQAVPLWKYAQHVQYPECQFWGVRNEATIQDYQCRDMWSQEQRDFVQLYLRTAQEMIEDELGYFLCPTWTVGTIEEAQNDDERRVDQREFAWSGQSRWKNVIAPGIKAVSTVDSGSVVNHATDPAIIGPVSTTVTDSSEIRVFHPDSTIPIVPSRIVISGGTVTIYVPRCRLVKESLLYTTDIDYDTISNFEATVDIYRVYNDDSTNAVIVSRHSCDYSCLSANCEFASATACMKIKRQDIGTFEVNRATYTGGEWVTGGSCQSPVTLRLYYLSGVRSVSSIMEQAIIRLAHTLMPTEPCGCKVTQDIWERDRSLPNFITIERASNPFGPMDGAWFAWSLISGRKVMESDVL